MKYIVEESRLVNIADAIRGKTGGTETLTLDQMPTEIAGISGGSGGDGSPQNYKICVNNGGFFTIPTEHMASGNPWTIAFTIDSYNVSGKTYSRVARGNNDVPSIFYTSSICAFQAKLARGSAHTNSVEVRDSSFISVESSGAIFFKFPTGIPTTFVFRNDGEYVTFWVNGSEKLRESASRYTEEYFASTFSIGDNAGIGADMIQMECSMLKAWNRALTDDEIAAL